MPAGNRATPQQRTQLAARLLADLHTAILPEGPGEPAPSRDRFIFFAEPLVCALVEGRKRMTRRPVRPEPRRKPTGPCPFGAAGDRLWVREKWGYRAQFFDRRAAAGPPFVYGADGAPVGASHVPWKPSMHMPRCACRAALRITMVSSQRLRKISVRDAINEGCPPARLEDPIGWFRETWDQFYAARAAGWEENPWVWVIAFEVAVSGGECSKGNRE